MSMDHKSYIDHFQLLDIKQISFDRPMHFIIYEKQDVFFLCYVQKHSIRLIMREAEKDLKEGEVVFGQNEKIPVKICGSDSQCFVVRLSGNKLKYIFEFCSLSGSVESSRDQGIKYYIYNQKNEGLFLQSLFEQLFREKGNYYNNDMTSSILKCIIHMIIRPIQETRNVSENEIVECAKQYLWEHYNEDITLTDVAEAVSVSTFHLSHLFKKETGSPPIQYLIQCRMEKAKELLRDKKIPITQIALRVGYDSPNYFSTVFKKMEGISPAEYRKGFKY